VPQQRSVTPSPYRDRVAQAVTAGRARYRDDRLWSTPHPPRSEQVLRGAPEIAAWVSGFFVARASKHFIPTAQTFESCSKCNLNG